ncbi:hypothetical protein [Kineococcus esterisolvens]
MQAELPRALADDRAWGALDEFAARDPAEPAAQADRRRSAAR